jgi:ABC-type oligopeptide transport system substrate-binding subunit
MTNRAARLARYPTLDRMMMQDAPVVPLYNPVKYELRSAALTRYAYSPVWWYSLADMAKS